MTDLEFDTPGVVENIFKLLEDLDLLREVHPFVMKQLKIAAEYVIDHELGELPDSYEVGYDAGYQEGKDRGYEDGASDVKDKVYDFVDENEDLQDKMYAFLEDMDL